MGSRKDDTHGMLDTEYGTQTGYTAQDAAYRGQSRQGILGAAQGLMDSGYSPELQAQARAATATKGYSPEFQSYLQQQTLGGIGETYNNARDQMSLRAARTGNSAGVNASMEDLAREEAKTRAGASQSNLMGFENEARNRELINLQIMQQLENEKERRREVGTGALGDLYKTDAGIYGAGRDEAGRILATKAGLAGTPGKASSIMNLFGTLATAGANARRGSR